MSYLLIDVYFFNYDFFLHLSLKQYCTLLASCDYHLMVVVDFELFMNESLIRTEAVKIMKAFMEIAPMAFPLEFASSLVSVAQQGRYLSMNGVVEADEFRFVALEILTSLAYTNYPVVAQVNGFKILGACFDWLIHLFMYVCM